MSALPPYPAPCNKSLGEIDACAAEFAKNQGYSPGGDLTKIVEQLGGKVGYKFPQLSFSAGLAKAGEPPPEPEADSILVEEGGAFFIWASRSANMLRNRFTIAHELGHYFLHSDQGKKPIYAGRSLENKRVEWEANWFAASFLMPKEEFGVALKRFDGDEVLISSFFLVSGEAVKVRMRSMDRG